MGVLNAWSALATITVQAFTRSNMTTTACRMRRAMPTRLASLLKSLPPRCDFFNRNWPASGGGYFRLMPYEMSRWMIERVNTVDELSAVFYFHPWEIDVEQPRVAGISRKTRFRHYVNINCMEKRLHRLLGDFSWGRMDEIFLGQA
jgi:hypothetical protein